MRQLYTRQIGRARDADIVQLGKNDAGDAVRWSFTAIKPNSFRWLGERSRDDGKGSSRRNSWLGGSHNDNQRRRQ